MDFCRRAQSALERDDPARGLMILVRGLRRHPEHDDGLDLFLFIYTRHIAQPGLETELIRGLEFHPDQPVMLRLVIDELRQLGKHEMADAVVDTAADMKVEIADESLVQPEDDIGGEPAVDAVNQKRTAGEEGEFDDTEQTDPQAAGTPQVESTPEELSSPPGQTTTSGDQQTGQRQRRGDGDRGTSSAEADSVIRRLAALGIGGVVLVVVVSVVVAGWQHARQMQRMIEVDEAMVRLDPLALHEARAVIADAQSPPGVDEELVERRQFVDALEALEAGDDSDSADVSDDPQTPWGLGAAAFAAAGQSQFEEAMRSVNYLEHAHTDSLPAYFVRGRICELRGEWECARSRYEQVQEHFQEFLPARLGAMRVAAYRFDVDRWRHQRSELADVDQQHRYAGLEWLDPFDGSSPGADRDIGDDDAFLRHWRRSADALVATAASHWEWLGEVCESIEQDRPRVVPAAAIACSREAARRADVETTDEFLEMAARPGMVPGLYRQLQIFAPRLMSDLGRAERGLAYAIPYDDVAPGADPAADENERVGIEPPTYFPGAGEEIDDAAAEALLARARVLVDLGAGQQARRALRSVVDRSDVGEQARFEQVRAYLTEGDREGAARAIGGIEDQRLRDGARAYLAYLEGRHGDAKKVQYDRGDDVRVARVLALAHLADGRGRDAMGVLDEAGEGLDTLILRPVKLRVFARAGEQAGLERIEQQIPALQEATTVEMLVDVAGAAFWQRDLEQAKRWLNRVLEVAPAHPEANWKMGMLKRADGDQRASRAHFRRAWRGDQDSSQWLIESARVHLDAERYEQARQMFLRVALRERDNVEAVRGLGKSYHRGDRQRGRRDLESLLDNYGATGEQPAQAEMLRWLAVLHDSRRGEEEALAYLQRARQLGGEQAVILVEIGRYHLAAEQWEQAREQFARALRIDPTLPRIHLGLATVAEAVGEKETAREHLKRLEQLAPLGAVYEEAKELLEKLEESGR